MFCGSCGKEIADDAKFCPHCGGTIEKSINTDIPNQGTSTSTYSSVNYQKPANSTSIWATIGYSILGLFVFVFIVGLMSDGKSSKNKASTEQVQEASSEEATPAIQEYSVNDTVPVGKFEVTVTDVKLLNAVGNEYLNSSAAEGGVYVAIRYKIKNISDRPIKNELFSKTMPTMNLIDSNGVVYNADADASGHYAMGFDDNEKVISDLNPGITVAGSTVFEISKESFDKNNWVFNVYSESISDSDKNDVRKIRIK